MNCELGKPKPGLTERRHLLLRIVLTLFLVLAGLKVGIVLAPKLGIAKVGLRKAPGFLNSQLTIYHSSQPDWGGGRLSFGGVRGHDLESNSGFGSCPRSGKLDVPPAGGVVVRKKPGRDYALTLTLSARGESGRTGRFELPSSSHFKEQLFPEGMGTQFGIMSPLRTAEAPAADIPLYPQSSCRMQVGRGTACFTGFYLTPNSVEAVRSFYVRVLSQLGWQRVTADRDGLLETFAKCSEDRTVVVQLRKQDSVTTRIGLVAMTPEIPDRNERK